MTVEMPMPDRPKRRWYQFRLFTMLVVVTVISVLMGVWVNGAHRQRDAVAEIRARGGQVRYKGEYEYDHVWFLDRLRSIFGVDYFADVSSVQFVPDKLTLTRKGGSLSRLDSFIDDPVIGDAEMEFVGKLNGLRHLDLGWTEVGDAGLAHVKGLSCLQSLDLSKTNVSDAGLAHLKGLNYLRSLDLSKTNVSDAGLAHLKGLRWLEELNLSKTKVTDAGIDEFQRALRRYMITGRRNPSL
jgi:internalin A